jgi:uncharacterized protein HemY
MDEKKRQRMQRAMDRRERDEVTWMKKAQAAADSGDMDEAKYYYHKAEVAAQDVANLHHKLGGKREQSSPAAD